MIRICMQRLIPDRNLPREPAAMPDDTLCLFPTALLAHANPPLRSPLSLADLPLGAPARVVGVRPAPTPGAARELALRLLELGFVEGEPVRLIAQGHPGREPIAVRVGGTTFALRRFEAAQVLVALVTLGTADAQAA
jgi:ferrous iron transport protein A